MNARLLALITLILLPLSCVALGRAHPQLSTAALFEPAPGRMVVSMPELSCATCGDKVARAITAVPGVTQAAFDKAKVEIGVAFDAETTSSDVILTASNQVGETVVMGAGKGSYEAAVGHLPGSDTIIISRGEEVTIRDHLALGKVTVVEFYADWCGPCRRVAVVMNTVMAERDDVALRKIDIVEWGTPVARQHMASVGQLPFTIVYNTRGEEVRRIVGLDFPALHAAIDEAGK